MQLLHSPQCCCCIKLRTAGLIIGWLEAISIAFLIFVPQPHITAGIVIEGLMSVNLLFGIYSKNSAFVLPAAVWHTIKLCLGIVGILIFSIASIISKQAMVDFLKDQFTEFDGSLYAAVLAAFFVILFAATVFWWYLTSVLFSLWKTMKDEERPAAMYDA